MCYGSNSFCKNEEKAKINGIKNCVAVIAESKLNRDFHFFLLVLCQVICQITINYRTKMPPLNKHTNFKKCICKPHADHHNFGDHLEMGLLPLLDGTIIDCNSHDVLGHHMQRMMTSFKVGRTQK